MKYLNTLAVALEGQGDMPTPRDLGIPLLPVGQGERFYLEQFMREFDSEWNDTAIIKDKTGLHDLAVSGVMFEDHKTGNSKIDKEGRAPFLLYVAKTILDPDEIRLHTGGHGDRTLYLLGRYLIHRDKITNVLAAFKENGKVWTGWTGYQTPRANYFDSKRDGILIYRRP